MGFFKDFKAELKKVIWPTPKQLVNNTVAVIAIVLITAVIVLMLDLTFESLNAFTTKKLQEIVPQENVIDVVEGESTDITIDANTVTEGEASTEVVLEAEDTIVNETAEN